MNHVPEEHVRWEEVEPERLFFFMSTRNDAKLLATALLHLRLQYPKSPVIVISDGESSGELEASRGIVENFQRHYQSEGRIEFFATPWFYDASRGGRYLEFQLELFLAESRGVFDPVMIKIDTDVKTWRPLKLVPTAYGLCDTHSSLVLKIPPYGLRVAFGTVSEADHWGPKYLQGGIRGLTYQAVCYILSSCELRADYLANHASYMTTPPAGQYGKICEDRMMQHVLDELKINCVNHPEILSYGGAYTGKNDDLAWAFTHKHK